MRSSAAAHITVLLLSWLAASETVSLAAQENKCLHRTVLASVVTQAGEPVANVPAGSFRATLSGKPVRILSATRDLSPRRVVVLLDASDSMVHEGSFGPRNAGSKWEFAGRAVIDLLNGLPPQDEVALLVFAGKVDEMVTFGEDRHSIATRISTLAAGRKAFPKGSRSTAMIDSMLVALTLLAPPRRGDVIYLITDGGDNASLARPSRAEKAALTAGVRVFVLGLVDFETRRTTREEMDGPNFLRRLAAETGGGFVSMHRYDLTREEAVALISKLLQLYSQMSQAYRLEIELPEPIDKPRKWKLELVDENGKEEKRWQVAYPKTLQPCK